MAFKLTKKDIIGLNQAFETGHVINEPSLDFAISSARRTENWIKSIALLVRAILLDHVFEEGNKRTAALLVKTYAEMEGHKVFDDELLKAFKRMLLKNITDLAAVEGMIKNAIK